MKFIVILVATLSVASAINITCEVQRNFWTPFGSLNECLLKNLSISTPHVEILSVQNDFLNFDDIRSFYIYNSPLCFYVPYGIDKHFKNIETLLITHSGLKIVTKGDLKPFTHLKGIYLDHNNLVSLGKDLFSSNLELEEILLSNNKLKHIAAGIFAPLRSLNNLELLGNSCVDSQARGATEIKLLLSTLRAKCAPKVVVSQASFTPPTRDADKLQPDVQQLMQMMNTLEGKLEDMQSKMKNSWSKVCEVCRDFQ